MYDVDSNISFLLPTRKLEALQQSSDHLSPETFCMSSFFIQLKPNYSFMGLWIMVCNFVQNLAARLSARCLWPGDVSRCLLFTYKLHRITHLISTNIYSVYICNAQTQDLGFLRKWKMCVLFLQYLNITSQIHNTHRHGI